LDREHGEDREAQSNTENISVPLCETLCEALCNPRLSSYRQAYLTTAGVWAGACDEALG